MTENQKAHLGNALVFMARYSLGRKTSADMATYNAIKSLYEFIPELHKNIIIKEIEAELPIVHSDIIWTDILELLKNKDSIEKQDLARKELLNFIDNLKKESKCFIKTRTVLQ